MIHTIRTVAVGDQESKIDSPIILYRGDREVEVEFTINGSKFTFTNGGNVIKSTNATHGQLVINTPTGENMFSEVTECHDGKVVFVITKEMIDELIEVGFYSFQIRLFDESQVSRVTIPPVLKGIDIRNPIAAEDETNVVDIALVDYAVVVKDEFEDLSTFLPDGNYNKTEWESKDAISGAKLNKIEDALYNINSNMETSDLALLNKIERISNDADNRLDALESVNADYRLDTLESVNTDSRLGVLESNVNSRIYIDDNETIQSALNRAMTVDFATVVLKPERYYITEPISIDISRIKLDGNGAVLDFSKANDNISCIRLYGAKSSPYYQNGNYIKELEIAGKGGTYGQVAIEFVSGNSNGAASHINLEKLNIHNFNVGIKYTSYCYLIRHIGVDIFNCGTCVLMPSGGADYGENILFLGCALYNSGVAIHNQNPNGSFRFTNCSVDYNASVMISDGGHIFFDNGHIEGVHEYTSTTNSGSYISVTNSTLVMNDTESSHVPFKGGGDMLFSNNYIAGGRFGSINRHNLVGDNSMVKFDNSKSYNICDFFTHDLGNVNRTTFNQHYEARLREAYDVTGKWNSKALNISLDGENHSTESVNALKVVSDYGAGSFAAFEIFLPVSSERFSISFMIKSSVYIPDGKLIITSKYASIYGYDDVPYNYLMPRYLDSVTIGDSKPAIDTSFNRIHLVTSNMKKPQKYNTIVLDFNLFMCDACTVWVDDIRITEF